ncbi:helix-turn-helix domain-containing protein [Priestia megaterium]|nr:helix-turn-helix domain-containing protein [Priestia megaterium]MDO6849220.1 helix-turn-helix domain-containing protein [Priestia megaterium]
MDNSISVSIDMAPLMERLNKLEERIIQSSQKSWLDEYPNMLTISDLMEILGIKRTKASELLNREDFPVFRLAGTKIPKHLFVRWIESHTEWLEKNTNFSTPKAI